MLSTLHTAAVARAVAPAMVLAAALCGPAHAQSPPPDLAPAPEPPEIPQRVESGETLEPEVTIIRRKDELVTEYRVNGRLVGVKVKPDGFPAYFLIDSDGDGQVDRRARGLSDVTVVPHWVLFSW